jgi:hypothetical protein
MQDKIHQLLQRVWAKQQKYYAVLDMVRLKFSGPTARPPLYYLITIRDYGKKIMHRRDGDHLN